MTKLTMNEARQKWDAISEDEAKPRPVREAADDAVAILNNAEDHLKLLFGAAGTAYWGDNTTREDRESYETLQAIMQDLGLEDGSPLEGLSIAQAAGKYRSLADACRKYGTYGLAEQYARCAALLDALVQATLLMRSAMRDSKGDAKKIADGFYEFIYGGEVPQELTDEPVK